MSTGTVKSLLLVFNSMIVLLCDYTILVLYVRSDGHVSKFGIIFTFVITSCKQFF